MLSVDGFSSERPDSGGAGNKKTAVAADEIESESGERGGKSPSSRKWVSGKAVAGGLLLMPRGAIQ